MVTPTCIELICIEEVLRRLLNSSRRLDWDTDIAPKISLYLSRMMKAGYPERYRKDTLSRCLRIYDRMVEEDTAGVRPLYRPKDYDVIARISTLS